jgi:serine protease Do
MKRLIITHFIISIFLFATGMTGSLHAAAEDNPGLENRVKGILHQVSPSIVKVVAQNHKRYIATGVVVGRGHVLSSLMVIRPGYDDIYVETAPGAKYPARVVGKDHDSSLILLQVDAGALTPVKWAAKYDVGDWIALVGVFYRKFPAIYQGIISSASDEEMLLNAPVAPGSSGGAVVNKKGELVGIIRGRFGVAFGPDYTYKDHSAEILIRGFRDKNQNLCYAVPAARAKDISADLEKYGKVRRAWLGVLLSSGSAGVAISYITPGSPADKAGVRTGDEVLKINEAAVRQPTDLARAVKTLKPQQKVKIEILRNNQRKSLLVVMGEVKKRAMSGFYVPPARDVEIHEFPEFRESLPRLENYVFRVRGSRALGVDVVPLTPELAGKFNVKEGAGLMVSKVLKNSAAGKAGFKPGDIIVKAGNRTIQTNQDLRQALNALEGDQVLEVRVYRDGKPLTLHAEPDKNRRPESWFERFRDSMKDIGTRIEYEKQLEKQELEKYLQERRKQRQKSGRQGAPELEQYQEALEKMRREQQKMKEEMKRLKKLLEKEKKENKKQK